MGDEPTLKALTKVSGVSMPKGLPTAEEEKKKAIEDSLDWLRYNDVDVGDAAIPAVGTLSKLAGLPLPLEPTPKMKAKNVLDRAVEWLRNAEPDDLKHIDSPSLQTLTSLAGVPLPDVS